MKGAVTYRLLKSRCSCVYNVLRRDVSSRIVVVEISRSHGDEYEDGCRLVCHTSHVVVWHCLP